ncbi:Uncharacterised protein [Anaerobiospirillum thomasii]|nr:Uncharacterised protein [Anaerobiospirillum thomasii]
MMNVFTNNTEAQGSIALILLVLLKLMNGVPKIILEWSIVTIAVLFAIYSAIDLYRFIIN